MLPGGFCKCQSGQLGWLYCLRHLHPNWFLFVLFIFVSFPLFLSSFGLISILNNSIFSIFFAYSHSYQFWCSSFLCVCIYISIYIYIYISIHVIIFLLFDGLPLTYIIIVQISFWWNILGFVWLKTSLSSFWRFFTGYRVHSLRCFSSFKNIYLFIFIPFGCVGP